MGGTPHRIELAPGLGVSRIITGLWQVADLERDGKLLEPEPAARVLVDYADDGFDTFDMADHYGSAELISGEARRMLMATNGTTNARFFTKWCPEPHQTSPAAVRAGINERRERLGVDTIDLLQLHWWSFDYPGYLDVMDELMRLKQDGVIGHIGLTNFDTDHLHVLLEQGYEIASNQVSCSLLDHRALGPLSALCLERNVKLLAYGTLAGGFISERWLDKQEPGSVPDWSKMKYKRFIDTVGGWQVFQNLLACLKSIAEKHRVTISNVATRWMLDQPAVAAVIIGARLTESEHRASNAAVFGFSLDDTDHTAIEEVTQTMAAVPGDCGDEYRRPPFLTASGDLSHHLDTLPPAFEVVENNGRIQALSGSEWEPVAGYCRAVRHGDRILVSGTTATHGENRVVCPGDVRGQTIYILDKIVGAVRALGGTPEDIIRTRIYLRNADDWEAASRVHGRYFGAIRPANTLIEISRLVGDYDVEIEAEAMVAQSH
ncbi:aldo/keto reductase [Hoeflea prorocentri]|uniref:Aldo/keto reductase n=1 Tax=Hoeflea prorocentri TaxID=1922333 RepID=A0A9X3UJQ3_9HYPH|nr:aldo/keto reductase [Hoeflea prorocentri]MCY6382607.1 aldo/keto reductase [Hoeflea prorocentri]MDA5400407.1 aldo/keto reductase [Hoeflea prorocentri]